MENLKKDPKLEEELEDIEDEEEDEEEEDEEVEEDEEDEDEGGEVTVGRRSGRGLTLKTLLKERILEAGDGNMTINYLGNKFKGDLLSDGRIRSQETSKIFGTPSAWAIFCKKIVNPDKKSGCGWASVRYKGKKLDTYKNNWFRQKRIEYEKEEEIEEEEGSSCESESGHVELEIVEFEQLGNRSSSHDPSTMVELNTFQAIGRLQPFNITMSSSAMAVIDLHAHVTSSEVAGYLAGQWDVNNHNLIVSHAFPLRSRLADAKRGKTVEKEALHEMNNLKLSLVGWYHTHPVAAPLPSLKDIDTQLDNEMKMKGYNDASYTPVLGIIVSPYNKNSGHIKGLPHANGNATGYWVMPPPENKPQEYGRPMSMQFTIVQDAFIPKEALMHMSETVKYYKDCPDAVSWSNEFEEGIPFWHKLLISLRARVPKDHFWPLVEFLKKLINTKLPSEEFLISTPTTIGPPTMSSGDEKPTPDSDIMLSPDLKSSIRSESLERQSSEDSLDRVTYFKLPESSKCLDSLFTKPKSPRPFSPFFHHTPPPPLFTSSGKDKEIPSLVPLTLQLDEQRLSDNVDKKDSTCKFASLPRDDKNSFNLDRSSSSYISTSGFLDLSLNRTIEEEKQCDREADIKPPSFALSDWIAQQKYPQDFFTIPHDRDNHFIRDSSLLHKGHTVMDLPSQWNTGLNLGKTPQQSVPFEASKTPLKLNPFHFSTESPAKIEKSPDDSPEKQTIKDNDNGREFV